MITVLSRIRDTNPKWITGIIVLLGVANIGWFLGEGHRRKTGLITADPYTYVRYAKNLAEGHYAVQGVIADLTEKYAPRPETKREGVLGPIWNTSLTSEGKLVYTVAMGYPLWLSMLYRIGGIEWCTYSNFILWASLFAIVMLVCREMFERKPVGYLIGVTVCSLTPMFNYQTFAQMLYMWREPLFLNCLFGGLLCLAIYQRKGEKRYLALLAFCLGYAFSIKEANGIYAPAFGISLLLTPRFREKGMVRRIAMMGVFFVIGCSPILIQNLLATGNPLYSLQSARAFPDPLASVGGAGWRWANYKHTTVATWLMYSELAGFRYIYLLPLLVGAILAAKHRVGRVILIMLMLHCALYLGWGNAEFRHMYFITIPTALFFTLGLALPIQALVARKSTAWALWVTTIVPLTVIAMHPAKWPDQYKQKDAMTAGDAVALKDFLDDYIEEPAVVLSHRFLRDILGTYTPYEVIRLSEMMELLDPEQTDIHTLIDDIREQGIRVYLVDNLDKDPKHAGRCDHLSRDLQLVNWRHQLREIAEIPVGEFSIADLGRKSGTRLYEVVPWQETARAGSFSTGDDGTAFIRVDLRGAQETAEVVVDGQRLNVDAVKRSHYIPAIHAAGQELSWKVSNEGNLLPAQSDVVQGVGWSDRIQLSFGSDVASTDRYYFSMSEKDRSSTPLSWRWFYHPFTLHVPVRTAPDQFTLLGFKMRKLWIKTPEQNVASDDMIQEARILGSDADGATYELLGRHGAYYLSLPSNNRSHREAGHFDLTLRPPKKFSLMLEGVSSSVVDRRLAVAVTPDTQAVGVVGRTVPEGHSALYWDWEMQVGGVSFTNGSASADISDPLNDFRQVIPSNGVTNQCEISFSGAGILRAEIVAVEDHIHISPGLATRSFLAEGFYPEELSENREHVVWTRGSAIARLPYNPKFSRYRLKVRARDGSPEFERELSLTVGNMTHRVKLGFEPSVYDLSFDRLNLDERGLVDLQFSIESWSPAKLIPGNTDDRELGFQLFSVEWGPVIE